MNRGGSVVVGGSRMGRHGAWKPHGVTAPELGVTARYEAA